MREAIARLSLASALALVVLAPGAEASCIFGGRAVVCPTNLFPPPPAVPNGTVITSLIPPGAPGQPAEIDYPGGSINVPGNFAFTFLNGGANAAGGTVTAREQSSLTFPPVEDHSSDLIFAALVLYALPPAGGDESRRYNSTIPTVIGLLDLNDQGEDSVLGPGTPPVLPPDEPESSGEKPAIEGGGDVVPIVGDLGGAVDEIM